MISAATIRLAFAVTVLSVAVAGGRPTFADQSLEPSGRAMVESVVTGGAEDLVLLRGGLAAGFRSGMVAHVERGSDRIGRVLIVEATADRAVALILELASGQTIQSEDRVLRSLISIS